jgi:DNA-directed RNA polymerase specialized sigma24 family protein
LCRAYWYPLYAYHRRRGAAHAEAEDAVQGFFARLLEQNILRYADPTRGRFRTFLLTAFQQFLARQHEYATAAKRSPPGQLLSLDTGDGDARYERELATAEPDAAFEYAWAVSVLNRAMDRLREEAEAAGKGDRFKAFHGMLTGQSDQTAREVGRRSA